MIDLKELRDTPERFIDAAKAKNVDVDIARLCEVDEQRRHLMERLAQDGRQTEQCLLQLIVYLISLELERIQTEYIYIICSL